MMEVMLKKEQQNEFFQKVTFFKKMFPDSKQDIRKA